MERKIKIKENDMKKSLLTKALLTFSVIGTVFAFSNTVKAADNYELMSLMVILLTLTHGTMK